MFIIKNIKWKPLILFLVATLGTGMLSSLLTRNSMDVYSRYNMPILAPPSIVFPIVWTVLYILMAISAYIIWTSDASLKDKKDALFLFFLQLAANFLWSIIFFRFDLIFLAFLWIILLWVIVVFMIVAFFKIKPVAAYLQIPYLLWLSFAAYLNLGIYTLNK